MVEDPSLGPTPNLIRPSLVVLRGRRYHGVQPPPHRRAGGAERVAQAEEVALAADVLLLRRAAPASAPRPRTRSPRPRQAGAASRSAASRARSIPSGRTRRARGVPVKPPMSELVGDREPPSRRPLPSLLGVDPDLADAPGAAALTGPGRGRARARQAPFRGPRRRAPAGRRGCRRSPRSGPAGVGAVPHVARDPGEERLGERVRSPPSAAIVFGGSTAEAEFHHERAVGASGARGTRARLASEHARDQLDEPPVARLDGVAHERRWVVGV